MYKHLNLWRQLVIALSFCVLPVVATAQVSLPATASTQSGQADAVKVEQLLQQSGYKYRKASDDVWVIEQAGKSMPKMTIILATGPGFMITGVVVAQKASLNVNSEMMFKLLKLNHDLDYVKIGFDDDDDLFVRSEVKTKQLDLAEFKEIVERVSADADQIFDTVKPYLR